MEPDPQTRPARHPLVRKLALALASLCVTLLVVELAVRLRQYARYGTFGTLHAFVHDPVSGLGIPPPGRTVKNFTVNEQGFRCPPVEMPKPEGRLRLAFLGASTTFCAEASSEEATWPARVAAGVAAQVPQAEVDYVNAGVGGYVLEQMQRNLVSRVAPLEPDVIFIYEATNDLTRESRRLAIEQGVYSGHADRDSWLARHCLAWYLLEKNLTLRSRTVRASDGPHLASAPGELSRNYRARLEELCDEAEARADLVVLMTFSIHLRRDQDPQARERACNTAFYYMPYMTPELLLDAFDEYNQVVREVAAERGLLLLDTAHAVPGDPEHFNDSVHFKDPGCAKFADAVLAGLSASPRWREFVGI